MSDFNASEAQLHYRNGSAPTPPGFPWWTNEVAGQYALAWEQAEFDRLVGDVFGYHALQLGLPQVEALRANRMPSRWLLGQEADPSGTALCADFHQLPFPASSLDLVVMPHTLEAATDPHQTLREVERVLRPDGRIVVTGFNPASLWGAVRRVKPLAAQLRLKRLAVATPGGVSSRSPGADPETHAGFGGARFSDRTGADALDGAEGDWVGYWRLRDWLRLLSFEVEGGRFGCYIPPVGTVKWRDRLAWMEPLGDRWWPVLGSVYALVAVKRVRGMRMVGLAKRQAHMPGPAPAIVTQSHPRHHLPRQGDGS